MKNIRHLFKILENRPLTHKAFLMRLSGDVSDFTAPGQFVEVALPGKYLRRPFSVCDFDQRRGELILLYDVVGEGTREMSQLQPGTTLDLLTGLGNGFSEPVDHRRPLLLGGGIGCAPLYKLALDCVYAGRHPLVILGFNTADDAPGMRRWLVDKGIGTYVCTKDGSLGSKGLVTDVIREKGITGDYFYACGPMPMLKALCTELEIPGEVSLECRMGCGFGACMCCSVETKEGPKRICKDGPVFKKEELIWN